MKLKILFQNWQCAEMKQLGETELFRHFTIFIKKSFKLQILSYKLSQLIFQRKHSQRLQFISLLPPINLTPKPTEWKLEIHSEWQIFASELPTLILAADKWNFRFENKIAILLLLFSGDLAQKCAIKAEFVPGGLAIKFLEFWGSFEAARSFLTFAFELRPNRSQPDFNPSS